MYISENKALPSTPPFFIKSSKCYAFLAILSKSKIFVDSNIFSAIFVLVLWRFALLLTCEYITEALLQLMNKKNYENITITDIAERAGVTRITFYRNFNTKDDIVKQYVQKLYKANLQFF